MQPGQVCSLLGTGARDRKKPGIAYSRDRIRSLPGAGFQPTVPVVGRLSPGTSRWSLVAGRRSSVAGHWSVLCLFCLSASEKALNV